MGGFHVKFEDIQDRKMFGSYKNVLPVVGFEPATLKHVGLWVRKLVSSYENALSEVGFVPATLKQVELWVICAIICAEDSFSIALTNLKCKVTRVGLCYIRQMYSISPSR